MFYLSHYHVVEIIFFSIYNNEEFFVFNFFLSFTDFQLHTKPNFSDTLIVFVYLSESVERLSYSLLCCINILHAFPNENRPIPMSINNRFITSSSFDLYLQNVTLL